MKKGSLLSLSILLLLVLSACNMPGSNSAEQVQTAAAETVSANLTEIALLTPSATNTPEATATFTATNTPAVTNTPAATNTLVVNTCDVAAFVDDVTVPDGTQFTAGATFTKTWRLKNAGTCTWSTDYALAFSSGESMSGPASQKLTANVAPGSTVDISVDLTAPSTNGSYTGYWALRNTSGGNFGYFYVEIKVGDTASTATGAKTFSASNKGSVNASGTFDATVYIGSNADVGQRGFVAFDISSIPTTATITQVKVDFTSYDTTGNPFSSMGCLQGYAGTYFPLDAGDYSASGAGPDMEFCSGGELSTIYTNDDVKTRLQAALGSSTLEYQLRFSGSPTGTTYVRLLDAKLIVTYTE